LTIPSILRIFSSVFLITGTVFAGAMAIGMIRFPDAYTRLHAGTKGLTVGAGMLVLGAAMRAPSTSMALRMIVVAVLFMLTNPIASQAIARGAYRIEKARRHLVVDEYAEVASAVRDTEVGEDDDRN
jgi:multicomponent Na+:H+ antiporter subunit G